jgi:hypothetical protein
MFLSLSRAALPGSHFYLYLIWYYWASRKDNLCNCPSQHWHLNHPTHDWKSNSTSFPLRGDILELSAMRIHPKLSDGGGHDQEARDQ